MTKPEGSSDRGAVLKRGYDQLAASYDAEHGAEAAATWRAGILPLIRRFAPRGGSVLDLGAGTGVGGRLVRQALAPRYLVGLDRSAAMLARAEGVYDLRVVGDISLLPFRSEAFDVCVAGFDTLNHLSLAQLRGLFSADQLGRTTRAVVIDGLCAESLPHLGLSRVAEGYHSTHGTQDAVVELTHHFPTMAQWEEVVAEGDWRLRSRLAIRLEGRSAIPGHFAWHLESLR
jgi:SAM-dependent methyltransferase